jgi:hypothetical protein
VLPSQYLKRFDIIWIQILNLQLRRSSIYIWKLYDMDWVHGKSRKEMKETTTDTAQRRNSEWSAISDTDDCLLRQPTFSLYLGTYSIDLQSFPRLGRKFCLVKKREDLPTRGFVQRSLWIPKSLNASLLLD